MKRMLFLIMVLLVLGVPLVFSGGEVESAQSAEALSFDKNTLVMANPQDINNFNALSTTAMNHYSSLMVKVSWNRH